MERYELLYRFSTKRSVPMGRVSDYVAPLGAYDW